MSDAPRDASDRDHFSKKAPLPNRRPGARERDAARQAAIEAAYGVRFPRLDAGLVERDTFAAVDRIRAAL